MMNRPVCLRRRPRGKTEAWLVLHAEPGARLIIGIQPGTGREAVASAIRDNRLENLLVYREVTAGDALTIPAGAIHALGPGLLIYEIQQSSDITYRLYDWGRMGLDGRPRDLHIDKGLRVAKLDWLPVIERPAGELLVSGDYFSTWRHQLDGKRREIATDRKFQSLTCIQGSVEIASADHDSIQLNLGESALLPACIAEFTLAGNGAILRSCSS